MQNPLNRVAVVVMLLALLVPLVGYGQQVPSVIPYQGSLADGGSPASGTFTLTFALYDSEDSMQALWTETREVEVADGRFSVQLGTQTALPSAVFEGSGAAARYLEVQVQGQDAFPRVPLGSAPFALRARLAEGVVPGAVDSAALDANAAVLSLNEGVGALTLAGANGATVNRDGSVITISAPGGDGASGILGVQNSDGTLSIQDPNGPTATIDILENGITTTQLADNAVTSANIADGTITGNDIGEGAIGALNLTSGATVRSLTVGGEALTGGLALATSGSASLSRDGNTITIGAAAGGLSTVNTNETLTGNGTDESALGIADGGVGTAQLANGAVAGNKMAGNAIQDGANINVTRDDNNNFVIAAPNALTSAVTSLNGLASGVSLVEGDNVTINSNNENNQITISAASPDAGLSSVSSDGTLSGEGTSDSPLGINDGGVDTQQLADDGVNSAKIEDGTVTGADISNGSIGTADLADDAAVTSLNGGVGTLTLEGANGVTVNRDESTITIAGPGDDGASGIQGIQNADGTLSIQDPNGPTTTIDILDNGITTTQLADNAVTSATIADGTITGNDIAEGTIGALNLTSGAAVRSLTVGGEALTGGLALATSGSASLSRDGNTITIGAAAGGLSTVNTNETLTGNGTDDSALGIAGEGVDTPQLAPEAVTSNIIADGGVQTADLASGAVNTAQLANDAVNSAIVADNSLTADDLATDAVSADELANSAVDGPAIGTGAVDATKLNTSGAPSNGDFLRYISGQLTWEEGEFSPSSIRWKENVQTLSDPVGLVERLRGVRYDWKEDGTADVGVIAEEVAEVLPEVVAFEEDGQARGVNYGKLVSVLIEATKTQQQTIESKTQTIERQQGEIDALKERMGRLERLVEQLDKDQ